MRKKYVENGGDGIYSCWATTYSEPVIRDGIYKYRYPEIYKNLQKDSINIVGILYASPNYLRMSMYLELSRPAGDVSRWEKVLKRLTLLNKNFT